MDYYIISILVAATVTIVPKVLPLFFLKGKTFNKKLMNFFHIVPYTSMTILITKYILTAEKYMMLPTILAVITSVIAAYITENMIVTVFVSILSTFICLNLF
ncbi:MAG: AzlD domain-containing protein [Peptoniphilaceae bacterium]|uniref:AzlD domain-containing protein n=1 Tax=Parvimonas sp. TaxID=1944660 RepID=UPI0025FC21E3|nr:AzlD domain-containing protein [Parvimonas sp.]MCI5996727.1 AzlD domain-containing protein [Parvimonas sp.]MDD7764528.1 AzlD domain-containing protein [Peptoniphilaceae bacterium]MDY3050454.1 AzlD domain-containing protein [Parvimonas sp.]